MCERKRCIVMTKSILEVVDETVRGLHRAGTMDTKTMDAIESITKEGEFLLKTEEPYHAALKTIDLLLSQANENDQLMIFKYGYAGLISFI